MLVATTFTLIFAQPYIFAFLFYFCFSMFAFLYFHNLIFCSNAICYFNYTEILNISKYKKRMSSLLACNWNLARKTAPYSRNHKLKSTCPDYNCLYLASWFCWFNVLYKLNENFRQDQKVFHISYEIFHAWEIKDKAHSEF